MKIKRMIKGIVITAALFFLISMTAFAEENTAAMSVLKPTVSQKGYVTITLPGNEWKEVSSDEACVVFSDGSSMITFDYYNKSTEVPLLSVPDGYTGFYNRSIDISNDIKLVFEAHSASETEFQKMKIAIAGAMVNTSLLPKEESSHEIVKDNYSIESADYYAYVTADELNIRPEGSSVGAPIGTLYYANEVHVTGKVLFNGSANGWVRIDHNGGHGYVSNDFLSTTKPSVKTETAKASTSSSSSTSSTTQYPLTFEQINSRISYTATMYSNDGTPVKLYVLTDGSMIDMNGYPAYGYADGAIELSTGEVVFQFDPTQYSVDDYISGNDYSEENDSKTLYQDDGSYWNIFKQSDGTWYDIYGNQFWMNEAGIWFNLSDHSEWYE